MAQIEVLGPVTRGVFHPKTTAEFFVPSCYCIQNAIRDGLEPERQTITRWHTATHWRLIDIYFATIRDLISAGF